MFSVIRPTDIPSGASVSDIRQHAGHPERMDPSKVKIHKEFYV